MKVLDTKFMRGFIKMADDGYKQGWHERNGGNLSYRLKPEEVEDIRPRLNDNKDWVPIGCSVPDLAGEFFLVTGTGKYFRNIAVDPEACLAIIELDDKGENYRIRWGLVALTFILPLKDEVFTRQLWESATECPVVFPDGVGVLPWMVPGGKEIGIATSKLMEKYDIVIWAHHGMFCAGEDFDLTFGLMHTVEKSAEILLKVLSVTPNKLQTITAQNLREVAEGFHVTLPERFLYEKYD